MLLCQQIQTHHIQVVTRLHLNHPLFTDALFYTSDGT